MIRFVCLGLLLLLASCQKGTESDYSNAQESNVVLTTFYPTTYFAQRIAGDHLQVDCPLPDGADPQLLQLMLRQDRDNHRSTKPSETPTSR